MAMDRDELRAILSTESGAVASKEEAQKNRGKAHDTFEALKKQYQADVQKYSQQEHLANVQLQKVADAKSKLIATAPTNLRIKLERLHIELSESKVDKGVDRMNQLLHRLDVAEQDYSRTNSGTDKSTVEQLKVAVKTLLETQERLQKEIIATMDLAFASE
jgi:hypothetical protein